LLELEIMHRNRSLNFIL